MESYRTTYICSVPGCGRSFDTPQALAGHEGSHKTVGEYRCPECFEEGMTVIFRHPQSLGTHRKHKHGVVGTNKKSVGKGGRKYQGGKRPPVVRPLVLGEPLGEPPDEPRVIHTRPEPEPVAANGKVDELIQFSINPLIERYQAGMTWLSEVAEEEARVTEELAALWEILKVLPPGQLQPPPGVSERATVRYTQAVSDGLKLRAEAWLTNRRNNFDVGQMARGMSVSTSTAQRLLNEYRDAGKVRLSGKRGHAKLYTSTISGPA